MHSFKVRDVEAMQRTMRVFCAKRTRRYAPRADRTKDPHTVRCIAPTHSQLCIISLSMYIVGAPFL